MKQLMERYGDKIIIRGKIKEVEGIRIDGHELVVAGKYLTIAKLKEEWDDDIEHPEAIINALEKSGMNVDLFTFVQRLPESRPKYSYPMAWDNVAAIPIGMFEDWLERQIHPNHRNKIRKAKKEGVEIRRVPFTDDLVVAISAIINEVPIRQGIPFGDYGKDFETIKMEHATYLERADFIGAYFRDELIGYIKLVFAGRYMRTMQVLSMLQYRSKATMNALMAEAVKICSERQIPYLVYGKYDYGKVGSDSLREFKSFNGFEHILLPRYHIPLTAKGRACLLAGLHRGIREILPRWIVRALLAARRACYSPMIQ